MAVESLSARDLATRWIKAAAVLLLAAWLCFIGPGILPYLLGLNYAAPGEILLVLVQSIVTAFVPLAFVAPVAWLWRVGSEAFAWFDSWPFFLLGGLLLLPVVFVVVLLAASPFAGSSLGGGMGAGAIALILAFETSLAYGLPRLFLPSLRPGRFRDAAWAE